MRQILNLNTYWKFIQSNPENAFSEVITNSTWEVINLPHTWNNIDGINGGNNYYRGACWYRREFSLSSTYQDKKVFLEFKGVNSVTKVYINGTELGSHAGGYSIFRFDLTPHLRFDKPNQLSVQVYNSAFSDIYPLWADFTFYVGIYRDVNLIITDSIHFDLLDHGSSGVYISQDEVTGELAKLSIKTRITNETSNTQPVRIWVDILDHPNQVVGANSIRLAHYQHDQFFYDLCDREGMIIGAEIPFISMASKTDFVGSNAKVQMVELIRQNFNHPSIIMWGVQNEIQIGGDLEHVRQTVKDLNALCKIRRSNQADYTS